MTRVEGHASERLGRDNGKLLHDGSANTVSLTLAAGNYTVEVAVDSSDFTISIAPQ